MSLTPQTVVQRLQALVAELSRFPWATTAQTLRERFREDRLGLTASSLTFTTLLALVPLAINTVAEWTAEQQMLAIAELPAERPTINAAATASI